MRASGDGGYLLLVSAKCLTCINEATSGERCST